jgi:hypothetical protein
MDHGVGIEVTQKSIISPLFTTRNDLDEVEISTLSWEGTMPSLFNFSREPSPRFRVRQYPFNQYVAQQTVRFVAVVDILTANFSFLSYEYHIPLDVVASSNGLVLDLIVRANRTSAVHLAVGAPSRTNGTYQHCVMRSVAALGSYARTRIAVDTAWLPLSDLTGNVSCCMFFPREIATVAFSFGVLLQS